jgi:multicomponent Na+:H+ antiporter subunit F
MFVAATLAILVTMALALARALLGPTVYDRILAVNAFGTKTVLLIAVVGFLTGRPDFLPSRC